MESGDKKLLEEFPQIEDAKDDGSEEARRFYYNLINEIFFEWASDHFGLDQYYESSEHLVEHIKWMIECASTRQIRNENYIFIRKIIGRSTFNSYPYFAWIMWKVFKILMKPFWSLTWVSSGLLNVLSNLLKENVLINIGLSGLYC